MSPRNIRNADDEDMTSSSAPIGGGKSRRAENTLKFAPVLASKSSRAAPRGLHDPLEKRNKVGNEILNPPVGYLESDQWN